LQLKNPYHECGLEIDQRRYVNGVARALGHGKRKHKHPPNLGPLSNKAVLSVDTMHHQVVALEKQHQPLPPDGFDFAHTLTAYQTTSTREELHARIHNATVIITTTVKLDAKTLHPDVTPHLQYIAASATGTDHVDLAAAKARGIRVTNCPGANLDAVSEHALSLYFAARRRTVLLDRKIREQPSEWKTAGSINKYMRLPDGVPPLTCKEEVLGVIGYGGLG
jgi:lactate dehydrogenase-like 2-hydroxyacid dehydrogenase